MKANIRRLLSMLLVLAMVMGMVPAVMADVEPTEVANETQLLAAFAAGGNIKLTSDITLTKSVSASSNCIPAGKEVTLDLNSHTISSGNGKSYYIYNSGTLTIKDSKGGGGMNMEASTDTSTTRCIRNYGNLTIEGGEYICASKGNVYTIFSEGGTVRITGGTFIGRCTSTSSSSSYHAAGLGLKGATATISGDPVFTGENSCKATASKVAGVMVTDGTVTANISGGTFMGKRTAGSVAAAAVDTVKGTATFNITGGTFLTNDNVVFDVSGYLNTEKYEQDAVTGTVKLKDAGSGDETDPSEPEDDGINTTEELRDAVNTGGEVTLADGFILTDKVEIPAGKEVILDLNGCTITSNNGHTNQLVNHGTLTIVDSRGNGGMIANPVENGSGNVLCVNNDVDGTLTINGGSFTANASTTAAYAVFSKGPSITVNDGTFKVVYTGNANTVQALGLGGTDSVAIINDGNFIAESTATKNARAASIYVLSGSNIQITINDGQFTSTRTEGERGASIVRDAGAADSKITIKGGTFEATAGTDKMFYGMQGILEIIGGTFTYDGTVFEDSADEFKEIDGNTITGGTFKKSDGTKNNINAYLTNDYMQDTAGKIVGVNYKVGDSEAFCVAMQSGGNIKLTDSFELADLAEVPEGVTVTLDLNGKTISSKDGANKYIKNAGNLTILDSVGTGRISTEPANADETSNIQCIYNYDTTGCLTIEGGTYIATSNANGTVYAIFSKGKSVTINDGTFTAEFNSGKKKTTQALGLGGTDSVATINYGKFITKSNATGTTRAASIYVLSSSNIQITINDGQFTSTRTVGELGASIVRDAGAADSKITINGGTFEATAGEDTMFQGMKGILEITGGTFTYDDAVFAKNASEFKEVEGSAITGGTFKKSDGTKNDISDYVAEGFTQVDSGAVVQVKGVGDSAAFCDAMKTGGYIRLAGDFELTAMATVPADKTVTLDLNGKKINSTNREYYIYNQGNLTILDSGEEGTISVSSNSKADNIYCLNNDGILTVEDGIFKVTSGYRTAYALYSKGKSVTINGGTFEANYTSDTGAYVCNTMGLGGTDSTVVINGGTFTANSESGDDDNRCVLIYVFKDSNVQITVKDGIFTSTREGSDGASFVRWSSEATTPVVTIEGGRITVTEGDTLGMFDGKKGTLNITGGKFLTAANEPYDVMEYLGEEYTQLEDGTVAWDDPSIPVVVELDGVKYKSLLLALKNSKAGDVLALQADVTLEGDLEIPAAVRVDLCGNTLEVNALFASDSQIVDSAQSGLLKVPKNMADFSSGNEHLPVWDQGNEGFRLAQVNIRTKTTGTTGVYYFRYDLVNLDWSDLLLQSLGDPVYKVDLRLHVDGQTFAPESDEWVTALYNDAGGTGAIKVTFVGMTEPLDVQVGVICSNVEITKSTGAEPAPQMALVDFAGKVDTLSADVRTYLTDATESYKDKTLDELVTMTTVKTDTNQDLYASMQPVAFNWTLENPQFVKASTKFYIELATDESFTECRTIDCVNFVAGKENQSEPVWNLMTGTTYHWRIVAQTAAGRTVRSAVKTFTTEAGPRMLHADGVENIRDQGGWLVSHQVALYDGTVVYEVGDRATQGLVYRSGRFEKVTQDGIDTIVNELGIKTEVDLRERNDKYDLLADYGVNFIQSSDGKTCLDYVEFMQTPAKAAEYLRVFTVAENYPIVYNCYHGADRTGSLSFILGALQGMSLEDLVKDYELTKGRYLNRTDMDFRGMLTEFNNFSGDTPYEKARTFCSEAGLEEWEIDNIILLMRGMDPIPAPQN